MRYSKIITTILFLGTCLQYSQAQTTENFVKTYRARIATTSLSTVTGGTASQSYKTFSYLDGLGRLKQTVTRQSTVNGKDLIVPVVYDNIGLQARDYLPYVESSGTQDGRFRTDFSSKHPAYYSGAFSGDIYGYSEKQFEASPLNRVVKQAAPGAAWRLTTDKEIKFFRRVNTSGDGVRLFTVNGSGLPVSSSAYAANTLWVETTDDEDNKRTVQYTDKLGRVVMKKVQNTAAADGAGHTGWLCTYYVYDDLGQLRVVIPPKAVEEIASANWTSASSTNTTRADGLYFRYTYDGRGRLIEKYVPGKGRESMVYDKKDRLVGFQDANMAAGNPKKWLYTKYDGLNRIVMTGLTTVDVASTRSSLQSIVDQAGANDASITGNTAMVRTGETIVSSMYDGFKEYVATSSITLQNGFSFSANGDQTFTARIGSYTSGSTGAWPTEEGEILTINYYDSYQLLPGFSYVAPSGIYSGFDGQASTRTHGLQTGKKVRNLETGQLYTTAIFYDKQGREIQSLGQQLYGGYVRKSTAYNFENQPTQSLVANDNAVGQEVLRTYSYNIAGLLAMVTHKIGSQPAKTISQNSYNDLGQLTSKSFSEISNGNQTYTYNIRGWLKTLGSSLTQGYKQTNYYETGGSPVSNWNGNISRIDWSGYTGSGKTRTYNYAYDKANRITAGTYSATSETNWFTVNGMVYDANGNITKLVRQNQQTSSAYGVVDNLTYTYQSNSNKLSQVADAATALTYTAKDFKERSTSAYTYDANGNVKTNADKQISNIAYNHLNLPTEITFSTNAKIRFVYDAEGTKLRQMVYNAYGVLIKTQDYIGEYVYLDGPLAYLIHEEGRVAIELGTHQYEYYVKDHLGNVRQVLRNPSTQVYMATMETQNSVSEEQEFTQIQASRQLAPEHNKTVGGNQVAWLNADRGRMVGPGRAQEIYAGDSLKLQVHGKYLDDKNQKVNVGSFVTQGAKDRLLTDLNELAVSTQRAGGGNPIALFNLANILASDFQKKETPEAYLIYALYDQDSNRYEVGKKLLSKNAANQHEELEENLYIQKDGFLETFVVNETSEDVWFDNMMVMSMTSPIAQETHYDPWGLELTGINYQHGAIVANKYLYNGIEQIDDLNLNIYSAEFRNYDPVIGRWWQIDPYDKEDMSPYAWVTNNPILYADPLGLDSVRYNDLNKVPFDPKNDIVLLDEVTVSASYTGPKASDSPNVRFALSQYYRSDRPLASGAVEPIYLTPNPVEAVISVTDNLSRGEVFMAGMAGFALIPGGKTMRGVVKATGLPISGFIRFIPPKSWKASQPLKKGPLGGYLDRFGNEWVKKKVSGKGPGEIHWDVQLSATGKKQFGNLSNSGGKHINVTPEGKIAH